MLRLYKHYFALLPLVGANINIMSWHVKLKGRVSLNSRVYDVNGGHLNKNQQIY